MKKKIIVLPITLLLSIVLLLGSGVTTYAAENKVATGTATSTIGGDPSDVVEFFDKELENALNERLGQAPGSNITKGQLQKLTSLDLKKESIKNLYGLENCTNLKKLDVSHNDIRDLSPIANLSKLEELNISYNLYASYSLEERWYFGCVYASPLRNLKNLKVLEAKDAALNNIDFLYDMKKLESVDVSENYISSIYSLFDVVKLDSLKKLDISDQLIIVTQYKEGKEGKITVKPNIWLPSNSSSLVNITNVSAGDYSEKDRVITLNAAEFFRDEITYNEVYYRFSDPDKYEGKDFKFSGAVINGIYLEPASVTSNPATNTLSSNNSRTNRPVNTATKTPKVTKITKKTNKSTKTGDDTNVLYYLGIASLSLGAVIAAKKKFF